jgi:CheY-like chemotaxis protein
MTARSFAGGDVADRRRVNVVACARRLAPDHTLPGFAAHHGGSGFQRIALIYAKAQRPDTVAIVISAFDDETLRKEAEQAGALYVLKPFTSEGLLTSLAQAPSHIAEL